MSENNRPSSQSDSPDYPLRFLDQYLSRPLLISLTLNRTKDGDKTHKLRVLMAAVEQQLFKELRPLGHPTLGRLILWGNREWIIGEGKRLQRSTKLADVYFAAFFRARVGGGDDSDWFEKIGEGRIALATMALFTLISILFDIIETDYYAETEV